MMKNQKLNSMMYFKKDTNFINRKKNLKKKFVIEEY